MSVHEGLAKGDFKFQLFGEKLRGNFVLVRIKHSRTGAKNEWLLIKHRDRFARPNDILAYKTSVLSGMSLDDISPLKVPERRDAAQLAASGPTEKLPGKLQPMLAESGDMPQSNPQWRYEPKLDGYRVIAFIEGSRVRLQSRRGLDLTANFPELAEELAAQPAGQMILDGEIVALDADGRPSFHALQNRAQLKTAAQIEVARRETPVVLVCFDLLHFAGLNLRGSPYLDRRRYLSQCLLPSAHLQLVHSGADAEELYSAALKSGFEGIVAKRIDSPYQAGQRSRSWQKIKAAQTVELLVGGYTRGKGARESLGALLLGYWEGRKLRYAGHVGSGLDDEVIAALLNKAAKLKRPTSPFAEKPPLHRPTTWLKPELVAEVTFSEWTQAGALRAPVFVRLREDIAPRSVRKAGLAQERSAAAA